MAEKLLPIHEAEIRAIRDVVRETAAELVRDCSRLAASHGHDPALVAGAIRRGLRDVAAGIEPPAVRQAPAELLRAELHRQGKWLGGKVEPSRPTIDYRAVEGEWVFLYGAFDLKALAEVLAPDSGNGG